MEKTLTNDSSPLQTNLMCDNLFKFGKSCNTFVEPAQEKYYVFTETNKGAMKSLLDDKKEIVETKSVSRIANLVHAEWHPDLRKAITSKLKGKTQHMGTYRDGKIALSAEETIFLLESGNLELCFNGVPLSTESAYSTVFDEDMAIEKYQVYAYLSRLGYVVVQHQKDLDVSKSSQHHAKKKFHDKKKPISKSTPLNKEIPLKQQNILNSQNCFVESLKESALPNIKEKTVVNQEEEIINQRVTKNLAHKNFNYDQYENPNSGDKNYDSYFEFSDCSNVTRNIKSNSIPDSSFKGHSEEVISGSSEKNILSILEPKPISESLDNCKTKFDDKNQEILISEIKINNSCEKKKSSVSSEINNKSKSISIKENNSFDHDDNCVKADGEHNSGRRKFKELVATELKNEAEILFTNSDVLYLYDSNDELESDEEKNSCNLIQESNFLPVLDDENTEADDVMILDENKTETEPLVVIDLSSDEEINTSENFSNVVDDDDVLILNECRSSKPSYSKQNWFLSESCSKFKSEICRSNVKENISSDMVWPFPNLYHKRVICLPRPPLNLVPFNICMNKESYTIDLNLLTAAINHIQTPRVWNSFKDLELMRRRKESEQTCQRSYGTPPQVNNFGHFPFSPPNVCSSPFPNNLGPMQQYRLQCPENLSHQNNDVYLRTNLQYPAPFSSNLLHNFQPLSGDSSHNSHSFSNYSSQTFSRNIGGNDNRFLQHSFFSPQQNFSGQLHEINPQMNSQCNEIFQSSPNPWTRPCNEDYHSSSNFCLQQNDRSFQESWTQNDLNNSRNWSEPFPRLHSRNDNPYPSNIPKNLRSASNWQDLKFSSVNSTSVITSKTNTENIVREEEDLQEDPFEIDKILWSNEIQPLVKPGPNLTLIDVLNSIKRTGEKILTKTFLKEKLLPDVQNFQISFDIYLPGTIHKRKCPAIPKHRIVVMRSTDPCPKLPEIYSLLRNYDDSAILQYAVVDNGDISFYSFNSINLPVILLS